MVANGLHPPLRLLQRRSVHVLRRKSSWVSIRKPEPSIGYSKSGQKVSGLVKCVSAVDKDVGASHEAGRVGSEEDAESVEVINGAQAVLGGH
jgi:hypothetical protein